MITKPVWIGLTALAMGAFAQQSIPIDVRSELAAIREEVTALRILIELRAAETELRDVSRDLLQATNQAESLSAEQREVRKELAETPVSLDRFPILIEAEKLTSQRLADMQTRRNELATLQGVLSRRIESLQNAMRANNPPARPAVSPAQQSLSH
jgi:chromosome segregation ATPase